MPAVFPNSVRIYTAKTDLVDTVLAEHVNLLQDEVTAVENTLGVGVLTSTWSGTFSQTLTHTSLTTRLANIEVGILSRLSSSGGTLTGALSGTSATFSAAVAAASFSGSGSALTALNASALSSGTVPTTRLTGTYDISVSGSAAKWTTARTISLTGDVTGSTSIDGSGNVSISASTPNSVSTTNGTVSTAAVDQTVVRNITISTTEPTSGDGAEGDVWLKTLA